MTLQTGTPVPFIAQFERFLSAQQGEQARLVSFYSQARTELHDFLLNPPVALTASEQAFYGSLQTEVKRLSADALEQSRVWAQIIPQSFVEGALQHSPGMAFNVIHDNATRALSGYTLDLITRMSDDMRRVVQQQIAVGLLEGATREAVSQRILASGLTNIPHWRTVEERAAAIARTEMMRAYNAGNLAGIDDTGAVAVRWITGADERVCPICGPRHDQKFAIHRMTMDGVTVPYPPLPGGPPPAHVKCRCTIRAFYDLPGSVRATLPEPVPGGMIDTTPTPTVPVGSLDDYLAKLRSKNLVGPDFDDAKSFFRGVDLTDENQLAKVALELRDPDVLSFFMDARYGVTTRISERGAASFKAWADDQLLRRVTIRGIERYRVAGFERNVVDSPNFRAFIFEKHGGTTLADCAYSGEIRFDFVKLQRYMTAELRGGAGVNGVEEIVTHELGHAFHNRFGVLMDMPHEPLWGTKAVELGGGYAFNNAKIEALWKEWKAIRRKSKGGIWSDAQAGRIDEAIQEMEDTLAAYSRGLEEWASLPIETVPMRTYDATLGRFVDSFGEARVLEYQRNGVRIVETFLDTAKLNYMLDSRAGSLRALRLMKANLLKGIEHYPTEYAKKNLREDFAESTMLYLLNPDRLKRSSPLRFAFIQKLFRIEFLTT